MKLVKLSNNDKAAAKVVAVITAGRVVSSFDVLGRQAVTVGTYKTAVPSPRGWATIGDKTGREEYRTAQEAAHAFVARVGSTRARDAAISAAKLHGIEL